MHLQKRSAFYLPLQHYQEIKPAILDDLEQFDLVCIDDVDWVIQDPVWEEALFHCYNRLRDKQTPLIISALKPPHQLPCYLPDLKTRLSSALVLKIQALSDEDKKTTLQLRAANRGIHLTEDVIQFMLRHYSRNMSELLALLDTLDRASLIAKRKITIPFVKSVMQYECAAVRY
jgi:DnaA family protein